MYWIVVFIIAVLVIGELFIAARIDRADKEDKDD